MIRELLEACGLAAEREASEARELSAAAQREALVMRTPFDEAWFAGLLAAHGASQQSSVEQSGFSRGGEAADR